MAKGYPTAALTLRNKIPAKLAPLFKPKRYKVIKGGRSSAKSHTVARALLVMGYANPLRVLCTREIQKSIKGSVHTLLKDQIKKLGLEAFYRVLDNEIRGANGTLFSFEGLSSHTVASLKSYEGYDIAWVEEAHNVCKRSWEILGPTIRKDNSEIWITFNPDLDTDETYTRFVTHADEDTLVIHMDYRDNPWFNEVMEKERLKCKLEYAEDYDNIWLGMCRPAATGAIYYREVASAELYGRVCNVPYDPFLRVHVVYDLGWDDSTFISLVQRNASEIRIIRTISDRLRPIDSYSAELREFRYNWGDVWLPHDGHAGNMTGKSSADILRKLGWNVIDKDSMNILGLEEGIRAARAMFPRVYFDKTNACEIVECLKRYTRNLNRENEPGTPKHNSWSHGADCFRYICINADLMTNEAKKPQKRHRVIRRGVLDPGVGY
jgi:phage terminase large subunit